MSAGIAFQAGDKERIRRKLDAAFLIEPEFDGIFDSAEARAQRGGKGLAARRNTITFNRQNRLSARVVTTLAGQGAFRKPTPKNPRPRGSGTPRPKWMEKVPNYNPRRTGKAWETYNLKVLLNIIGRSLSKAAKSIETRWAS